ncbi:hypothetical protein BGZ83_006188 [Gryganskiella cystojenkinii]|nr:hypothetical protein BGZ83_006188 [Gryganskiella cystojenkinii]
MSSHAWHSSLSPFLNWLGFDNCDRVWNWTLKKADQDKTKAEKLFKLEIDTFKKRIKAPAASFDYHVQRRQRLSNRPSYQSFILQGFLLFETTRAVDFYYIDTTRLRSQGNPPSTAVTTTTATTTAPSTATTATSNPSLRFDANGPGRPGLVCDIIERSKNLVSFEINDQNWKGQFYKWSQHLMDSTEKTPMTQEQQMQQQQPQQQLQQQQQQQLQQPRRNPSKPPYETPLPLTMVTHPLKEPRWPKLTSVILFFCQCHYSFIRVLLSNAPALKNLSLVYVTIMPPEVDPTWESQVGTFFRGDFLQQHRKEDYQRQRQNSQVAQTGNINMALSQLETLNINHNLHGGLYWTESLLFAQVLPKLKTLSYKIDRSHRTLNVPVLPLFRKDAHIQYLMGLFQLEHLTLECIPYGDLLTLLRKTRRSLVSITLSDIPLEASFLQVLHRHSWTMTTIFLRDCPWVRGGKEALPIIMTSMRALRSFSVFGQVIVCDPLLLQTPWVCQDLQVLVMNPKCDGGGSSNGNGDNGHGYSSQESQVAFLKQVGSLRKLIQIQFPGGVGMNGFHPAENLDLLQGLDQLEVLALESRTIDGSAKLTVEHAEMMVRSWPKLKSIRGLRGSSVRPFIEFMEQHRPEVDL